MKRYYWLGLVLLWMVVMYIFSAEPNSGAETERIFGDANFWVRKLAHVGEYALLTYFWGCFWRSFTPTLLCSLLFAISDEYHQYFIPGRTATPVDVLIDGLGIFLACWFLNRQGKLAF